MSLSHNESLDLQVGYSKISCEKCGNEFEIPNCCLHNARYCPDCREIAHVERSIQWGKDNREQFNKNHRDYYWRTGKKKREERSKYNNDEYLYKLIYDPENTFINITFKIRTLNRNIREKMFNPGTIFINEGNKTYHVVTKKWKLEQINSEYAQQFI